MKSIIFVVLLGITTIVAAEENNTAKTNYGNELADCAAYYAVTSTWFSPDLAKRLLNTSHGAAEMSARLIGLEATKARMSKEIANQKLIRSEVSKLLEEKTQDKEKLNNANDNMKGKLDVYAQKCKMAVFRPEERLKFWEAKDD